MAAVLTDMKQDMICGKRILLMDYEPVSGVFRMMSDRRAYRHKRTTVRRRWIYSPMGISTGDNRFNLPGDEGNASRRIKKLTSLSSITSYEKSSAIPRTPWTES
jgi:hypothetical protein